MHLIANITRISHTKFHCNRLTTVQDIQDYVSLIFLGQVYIDKNDNDRNDNHSNITNITNILYIHNITNNIICI